MKKVFLYLYPIKEFFSTFLIPDDEVYDILDIQRPLPILNECIQKRYRDNGYQVVYALYPDTDIFGIKPKKDDKIIYTDILFSEHSDMDENGKEKKDFIPKSPNERQLINQLGNVEQLVIGGFHYVSCVKRVGEIALHNGIDTIVDLDMTDLFFTVYKQKDYFNINEYNPKKYKEYLIKKDLEEGETFSEKHFKDMYPSLVYGFYEKSSRKRK